MSGWDSKIPEDASAFNNDGNSEFEDAPAPVDDFTMPPVGDGNAGSGNDGACFKCGQQGHMKSDCTNEAIAREFTGTCRLCEQEGHRAADCPSAPPRVCKNCGEEGHNATSCKSARLIDRSQIADILPELAWKKLELAAADRDLDDVKEAIQMYIKALPATTYVELENAFRNQDVGVYLIAMEREVADTYTIVDLQGNLDRKYTISYRFSDKPMRPRESESWPASPAENLERLAEAGEPMDRGIPKCGNCDEFGHIAKNCTEEKQDRDDRVAVKCYNCDEVGHRVRDCPTPRPDRFACRNCGKSGHGSRECPEPRSAEGVECKKCNETGHFARDCPTGGGGESGCRNCGQEGHRAKECTEPRNPATMTCRNCDEVGHLSKECPKPRDYSRVTCQNCQQTGHTKVRCKQPLKEEDAGDASAPYEEPAAAEAYNGGNTGDNGGDGNWGGEASGGW